ncbi:hypothetical protein EB796_017216 [Bugula neritina]|uniref:Uncharacterized protein n=1 Tax=Bugula neritina TaxID=10212 RepID=A0A7J7JFR0_BUGNE|nr:hypothetical protein EB796_017216 [Bugula neritina]
MVGFRTSQDENISLPITAGFSLSVCYLKIFETFLASISTGPLSGINNRESTHSACKRYNMKAIVRVCCNDSKL